ncbi:MAG: ABC transporter permease [Acidobacteria bacterium]|nr:ABC transporter permease [Acidobacteriota bacterium]
MALAAFLGLVLGVLALVVALALLAGFQKHVRARLAAETPHVTLEPLGRDAVRESEGLEKELRARPDVTRLSVVARGRVWVSYGDSSVPAIAVGRTDADGLALTASQARDLGVFEGDTVRVVSSRTRLSPLGPVPIVGTFEVGALRASSPASRRVGEAELPLAAARRLFLLPEDGATAYELTLRDPNEAPRVAAEIAAALAARSTEAFRVTTWEDANRALVTALRLERFALFATVFLIVFVAGLNLAATSAVLAATRSADAAVLAVLGASPGLVARVFLLAGLGVGVLGTATGLVAGTGLAMALDRFALIPLPAEVFGLAHVPFTVRVPDLLAIAAVSLLWSVVAASWPSRAASRLPVAEALRAA